jgi:type II secretory pathway pseudopilin PulG
MRESIVLAWFARVRGRVARCLLDAARARNLAISLGRAASRPAPLLARGAGESGMTLIEVMISAMLVAIIAIATFTGFDDAGRATATERSHNQASLLAEQDQERLRGLELTKLTQIGHESKTVKESGTNYTVESFAEYVDGNPNAKSSEEEPDKLACSSTSSTAEFIKSTTIVSWYEKNPPVKSSLKQSSIVSVPSSNTLQVDVIDQNENEVPGATVTVKGASTNLSQTTLANGCVIFGSVADKTVEADATKSNWVGPNGSAPAAKSVTLSSTKTSPAQFTLAEPGKLLTEFDTNGGASGLEGDTVYVGQSSVGTPPNFVAGTAGKYATSVSLEGLFPFPSSKYTVYAGDCEKNNPEVVTSKAVKDEAVLIEPGAISKVKVEEPQVNLLLMSGTKSGTSTAGAAINSTSAKLINTECKSSSAQNLTTVPYERTIEVVNGRLKPRYAPYAKSFEVCVAWLEGGKYYRNKTTFANTAKAGSTETTYYAKASGYSGPSTTALPC